MDESYLNQREQKIIQNIVNTTKNIENIYKKLYKFEVNNQKNSEAYQKYLEYLNMFLGIENEYYSKIDMSFEKISYIISCILSTANIDSDIFMSNETIFNQDYENRIAIRMCKKLFEILQKDSNKILSVSNFDPVVLEKMGGYDNFYKIYKSFRNDTLLGFVFFINENINDEKQTDSIKNELIKAKYNTLFINSELESKTISNNFDFSDLSEEFGIEPSSLGINSNAYEEFKFSLIIDGAQEEIGNLLDTSDIDYSNLKNIITSILRVCFVRSSMSLLDSYDFELFKRTFYKYIETTDIRDTNISKQLIENCLNSYPKDKARQKNLSLD